MQRELVSSSYITEIGYDPDSETLEVMIKNERVYQYYNVPPVEFDRMMEAPSVGTYFNAEIKGQYQEARV